MKKNEEGKKKGILAELLSELATQEGRTQSALEGVYLIRSTRSHTCSPVIYEPNIIFVGQGQKKVYLGDRVYTYNANNYLALSVPLPVECETEASPENPLLAISLRVEPAALSELLIDFDDEIGDFEETPRGIYATPITGELLDAVARLVKCLRSPADTRVLGKSIVREILYRVLCGEQGSALRAAATRRSSFSQIAKVLRRIHEDYSREFTIKDMADEANMSESTFFNSFKAVTSVSPLQYVKSIRLHKARLFMFHDGLNASVAADRVGYASASQFSREFKRLFGASPVEEIAKLRAL